MVAKTDRIVVLVCAMLWSAPVGAANISVGSHELNPNTAGQEIEINITGSEVARGFVLAGEIGDGIGDGVEPVFHGTPGAVTADGTDGLNLNNTLWSSIAVTPSGNGVPRIAFPSLASINVVANDPSDSVLANGLAFKLLVDTTGFEDGTYDLSLTGTVVGDTYLIAVDGSRLPITIENGTINIVSFAACDFDRDSDCDIQDIDLLLYTGVANNDLEYDFDNSGEVTLDDRVAWLSAVGTVTGDFNLDGKVNSQDLNAVGLDWQGMGIATYARGDADGNGNINSLDLNAVGLNWQHGVSAAGAAVPEPSPLSHVLIGTLFGFLRYRRRKKV